MRNERLLEDGRRSGAPKKKPKHKSHVLLNVTSCKVRATPNRVFLSWPTSLTLAKWGNSGSILIRKASAVFAGPRQTWRTKIAFPFLYSISLLYLCLLPSNPISFKSIQIYSSQSRDSAPLSVSSLSCSSLSSAWAISAGTVFPIKSCSRALDRSMMPSSVLHRDSCTYRL